MRRGKRVRTIGDDARGPRACRLAPTAVRYQYWSEAGRYHSFVYAGSTRFSEPDE